MHETVARTVFAGSTEQPHGTGRDALFKFMLRDAFALYGRCIKKLPVASIVGVPGLPVAAVPCETYTEHNILQGPKEPKQGGHVPHCRSPKLDGR